MKPSHILTLALSGAVLSGCAISPKSATPIAATAEYAGRDAIATSLFPSDQAVMSDDAVGRILSSKLELPAKAKVALMKFPDGEGSGYYGRHYWRDEDHLKLQQSQVDTLTQALLGSDQIVEVTPLPSLMTPSRVSIPVLREAAVRMQADLLLVFRVGSDTYSRYRTFSKDTVKAYSTSELVLLDVRTGLVPFTRVVSRERLESKQPTDLDLSETMRRAEQASAAEALKAAAEDLVRFVRSVPRKSGQQDGAAPREPAVSLRGGSDGHKESRPAGKGAPSTDGLKDRFTLPPGADERRFLAAGHIAVFGSERRSLVWVTEWGVWP